MIIEKKVEGVNDIQINVKKKSVPQSTNENLPLLFNTQLYIGSKGTGKSYKLTQLLKLYEKSKIKDVEGVEYEMRTILICPTAHSGANEVYKSLKSLDLDNDVYLDYSDDLINEILENIKIKQKEYDEYLEIKKIFDKYNRSKNLDKLTTQELEILEKNDFIAPEPIKPQLNFLIFDDLIGLGVFNKKAKSIIANLTIKHRHLKTNLIFTTQSYKYIPPIIRNNIDIFCIFKSASYKEILEKIYQDISGYININDFFELYEHATQEKNDCLTIINNSMSKKGVKFFKNWDIELVKK